ncbi:MAG: hypothetical protein HYX53_01940 [Chloroflexi bacterium]|nr:hypothetical protein [Chloroflexota bacterium]
MQTAFAAANPSGTGQPNQECEDVMPHGFTAAGFENAESHYAGEEGTGSEHADSDHAASQYDVACFQLEQRGG